MDESLDYSNDSVGEIDSDVSFERTDFDTSGDDLSLEPENSDSSAEDYGDSSADLETADAYPVDDFDSGDIQLPEDIPEDLPEASGELETLDFGTDESADLPEDIPEDLPEVSEGPEALDFGTDESADLPEDVPEDLPEASGELETLDFGTDESADLPEDIPEDLPEASEEPETSDFNTDESAGVPSDVQQNGDFQFAPEESGPVKTLKLSDDKLLEFGNSSISAQLEGLKDNYAAQGLSDAEIADKIAADRWKLQQQYLDETFPGQALSPHAFNGFYENGASDRIKEIEQSPSLQEIIGGSANSSFDETEYGLAPDGQDALLQSIDEIADSDLSTEHKLELLNQIKTALTGTDLTPSVSEKADLSPIPEDTSSTAPQDLSEPVDAEEIGTWLKDINPNFDPFDIESPYCNNCGSCAFAVEQHLSGNPDITATAENIGTVAEMNELTGMEQVPMRPDEIQQYLLNQGPGAHAIVGIDRADGPGHWFNAICLDDHTVVALDGQSGEMLDWPPDYGNVTNWDVSMKKEEI